MINKIFLPILLSTGLVTANIPARALTISQNDSDCAFAANSLLNLYPLRSYGMTQDFLRSEIARMQISDAVKSKLAAALFILEPPDPEYRKHMIDRGRYEHAFQFFLACSK